MAQVAPFRMEVAATVPAADHDTLLVALGTRAEVQTSEERDLGAVLALIAVIKPYVDAADTVMKAVEIAAALYGGVQALRRRGIIPKITLARPGQPSLELDRVQNAEEIEAWLRRVSS